MVAAPSPMLPAAVHIRVQLQILQFPFDSNTRHKWPIVYSLYCSQSPPTTEYNLHQHFAQLVLHRTHSHLPALQTAPILIESMEFRFFLASPPRPPFVALALRASRPPQMIELRHRCRKCLNCSVITLRQNRYPSPEFIWQNETIPMIEREIQLNRDQSAK